ncbi:MAG: deoxyribodipyrimidine photo-lyase [Pseudomonadota bacterium]
MTTSALLWFRRDLRLADNPALRAAIDAANTVTPVYVLDDDGPFAHGGAAKWWLHHSLKALDADLRKRGSQLVIRRGDGPTEIRRLVEETGADAVYWNRRYDKYGVAADKTLKTDLADAGVDAKSFNGALLREPWELQTKTGGFYKVFTPFWRALQAAGPARDRLLPTPKSIPTADAPPSLTIDDLELLPNKPNWASGFDPEWAPGEKGAGQALNAFLKRAVGAYDEDRNRPDLKGTSRLSPHLAFGEISPLQVWMRTKDALAQNQGADRGGMVFLSEIAWREFAYVLLYHYPDIQTDPIKPNFAHFDWRDDEPGAERWRRGQTGFPIVDAGMRQLWTTGWMHNRVRMIVASFLSKNMLVPWQDGERWFWDTLLDADPASNTASWQWVAGSGADAAPYFRIFNPVSQGQKFDPDGDYVRTFVPELSKLSAKHIHTPYEAPPDALHAAGVRLGETYPTPMLDLGATRKRALASYESVKMAGT